jgi:hypothetical protein
VHLGFLKALPKQHKLSLGLEQFIADGPIHS